MKTKLINKLAIFIIGLSVISCNQSDKIELDAHSQKYEVGSHLDLEYVGDYPTSQSLEQLHQELKFQSAVQIAIWAQPLVAVGFAKKGMKDVGIYNTTISIAEQRASSDNVIYTANQETVYAYGFTEIGDEPMVFNIAPMSLGFMADAWQRPIEDLGLTGPDAGKGGEYIIIPPGYKGEIPNESEGVFIFQSPTKTVFWLQRAFVKGDQTEEDAVNILKTNSKIYPLSKKGKKIEQHFVNQSVTPFFAVTKNEGMNYWNMLNSMIQLEPIQERDYAIMGLAKSIGIIKGEEFKPNEDMKKILIRAAEVAKGMMVAIGYDSQNDIKTWKGLQWESAFQTKSPYFDGIGHTETHERGAFTYQAMTGAKSMVTKMVGKGSQYQLASKDSDGNFLNGSNTYRLTVPANVPINNYWSICVYDVKIRSLIQNGTPKSSTGSHLDLEVNADGSVDLYFGPEKPENVKENNFVLTNRKEGWFTYFRFYGPEQAYFDKTWTPNDFMKIK